MRERLESRPILSAWAAPYMEAFQVLASCRQYGASGPEPLQLSEIVQVLNLLEVRGADERLLWVRMVKALDRTYMEHVVAKMESDRARRAAQSSAPRRTRGRG